MKDLPRVYVNPINKEFSNYQKESGIDKEIKKVDNKNLSMKIKDIFNSRNYIYRRKVNITTKNGIKEMLIVGKTKDHLLTIEGDKIRISDIFDIEII